MKIAYLIIAHEDPEQLGRLVSRLNAPFADIFIHLDAKKDISLFKKAVPAGIQVKFIDNRVRAYRGGFSVTRSMIELLKEAAIGDKYDYYQSLSGLDYPIKSNAEILAKYQSAPGASFINYYELTPEASLSQNIYDYHWVDMYERMPGRLKHYFARLRQMLNKFTKRPFLKGVTPYRGSQWFALSRDAAQGIVTFLKTKEGKHFYNFFRFTWAPDEILFQTLIFHLGFTKCEKYLHYIDWNKSREDPAVFDMSDLEILKNRPELFARKFRSGKSSEVLKHMDERIKP